MRSCLQKKAKILNLQQSYYIEHFIKNALKKIGRNHFAHTTAHLKKYHMHWHIHTHTVHVPKQCIKWWVYVLDHEPIPNRSSESYCWVVCILWYSLYISAIKDFFKPRAQTRNRYSELLTIISYYLTGNIWAIRNTCLLHGPKLDGLKKLLKMASFNTSNCKYQEMKFEVVFCPLIFH